MFIVGAMKVIWLALMVTLYMSPSSQLFAQTVVASAPAGAKPAYVGGETSMDGYTLKQFDDFVHNWKLVTVRYRRDSGEMRFIYANPLAWKALQAHSLDYPDGAVFAKVGVATSQDPTFLDSAVPAHADHIQIMVRDKKKHAHTDGWGYAIFNMQGVTSPGKTLADVSEACNACHLVVKKDRGMVFSVPMPEISPLKNPLSYASTLGQALSSHVPFKTVPVAELPTMLRSKLPTDNKTVRQMEGSIPEHMFQGSMHESIPFVGAEAARSNMPTVLLSKQSSDEFSVMWPAAGSNLCKLPDSENGRMVQGMFYAVTINSQNDNSRMMYVPIPAFCAPSDPEKQSK